MLGNLPTLNLLSTIAMTVTGIMIDKSFFVLFPFSSTCHRL